jgi:hypothetical protein
VTVMRRTQDVIPRKGSTDDPASRSHTASSDKQRQQHEADGESRKRTHGGCERRQIPGRAACHRPRNVSWSYLQSLTASLRDKPQRLHDRLPRSSTTHGSGSPPERRQCLVPMLVFSILREYWLS